MRGCIPLCFVAHLDTNDTIHVLGFLSDKEQTPSSKLLVRFASPELCLAAVGSRVVTLVGATWESMEIDKSTDTASMASRYEVLHGRPGVLIDISDLGKWRVLTVCWTQSEVANWNSDRVALRDELGMYDGHG